MTAQFPQLWADLTARAEAAEAAATPQVQVLLLPVPTTRLALPAKIISSVLFARRLLNDCSPRTHWIASAILDLPLLGIDDAVGRMLRRGKLCRPKSQRKDCRP